MKKLNSSLCIILIVITAFCTTTCSKDKDSDGIPILLGNLGGLWKSGDDSFTFQDLDGQLAGSGFINKRNGNIANSIISGKVFTFDLIYEDDDKKVEHPYRGTMKPSKTVITLTLLEPSGRSIDFTKQQ
jgi:hypothetical protein